MTGEFKPGDRVYAMLYLELYPNDRKPGWLVVDGGPEWVVKLDAGPAVCVCKRTQRIEHIDAVTQLGALL